MNSIRLILPFLGLMAMVTLVAPNRLCAQDAQLTQFYAAAPHLNPAFAGGTLENRIAFHYRNQWPGLPGRFVSYGASYDVFIPKIRSGLGVIFSSDEAGTGALGSSSFAFQYSYEVPLGDKLSFRPGLQLGWGSRGLLNWQDLVFGDQLNRGVADGGATGSDVLKLAEDIQADVLAKFGVSLEREVNVLPLP